MSFYKFQPIFIVLLVCLFAPTITAQNQARLVETLDIQGNRRLTDESILPHIKTRPGDLFDEKQVKEDLQKLRSLGLFNKNQLRYLIEEGNRGGVYVIFEVNELPLIAEVDFGCPKFVTKDELISELRARNVKMESGEIYAPENVSKARRIILEYLGNRGFIDAKVEIYEEEVNATSLKVGFKIKESPGQDEDCCCEN